MATGTVLEGAWTRDFSKWLEQRNAMVLAVVAHEMQAPGWPDRYVVHSTWSGWIEVKNVRTPIKDLQTHRIDKMRKCGVNCCVLRRLSNGKFNADEIVSVDGVNVKISNVLQHLATRSTSAQDEDL